MAQVISIGVKRVVRRSRAIDRAVPAAKRRRRPRVRVDWYETSILLLMAGSAVVAGMKILSAWPG